MRVIISILIFLVTTASYANTTYICSNINGNYKTVYEIKKNKLFIDDEETQTLNLKVNKSTSEFQYEYSWNNKPMQLAKGDYESRDGKIRHKVDLKTGNGFVFNDYTRTMRRWSDDEVVSSNNFSKREILKCYGFSIKN
tara:strand:+ start:53 stop:469 length:417 start_codon:yes stop_codon:yes gene_type:complete